MQMQLKEEADGTLVGETTKASPVHRVYTRRKRGRRRILDRIRCPIVVVVVIVPVIDPHMKSRDILITLL
jgi:hypothetical protein